MSIKVLICDDSMLVRKKLTTALKALGINDVYEAADGEQAVSKFKEVSPDLTLMDIVMPKINGVDALKAILTENSKAKVVMASSVGTQENLKEAINAGAYDFLQKPITEDQIKALIEKISK
ncbi:MAG: response regulator [Huintestinicola sp.]